MLGGLIGAVVVVLLGHILSGGSLSGLFSPGALLLVLGGTVFATQVSVGFDRIRELPGNILLALRRESGNEYAFIDNVCRWRNILKESSATALEQEAKRQSDHLLRFGLQEIANGRLKPEELRDQMYTLVQREMAAAGTTSSLFETAGGYSPTMGIIATVLGLIDVLGNLTNPAKIGPAIASAFLGTLYGIAFANIFWLPISARLRSKAHERGRHEQLYVEGITMLAQEVQPTLIREHLTRLIDPKGGANGAAPAKPAPANDRRKSVARA